MQATTLDPAITVLRASTRMRTETSWLDSWHCFSYGRHYEPDNTHHGLLLVCNDDTIRGSTGFAEHAHEEMEIVTWMVEGELEHRDCAAAPGTGGGTHVLRPGMVRRLSAGRGFRHSEMNPAGWAPARYIEMWVPPDREGVEPGVELADVSDTLAGGGLVPVASGAGHQEAVHLHQTRAVLWAARLAPGEHVMLPDAPHVHVYVVLGGGVLDTGGLAGAGPVEEGDSVRLTAAGSPTFVAHPTGMAEILVWETG
jgi:redox-sensitive bicupin YhaK (pirin superfamily)